LPIEQSSHVGLNDELGIRQRVEQEDVVSIAQRDANVEDRRLHCGSLVDARNCN
jgi:hypothetical protein